jgi:hypothetical protein
MLSEIIIPNIILVAYAEDVDELLRAEYTLAFTVPVSNNSSNLPDFEFVQRNYNHILSFRSTNSEITQSLSESQQRELYNELSNLFKFNQLGVLDFQFRQNELQHLQLFKQYPVLYKYWLNEMILRDGQALNLITSKTKLNPSVYCNQLNIYINLYENPNNVFINYKNSNNGIKIDLLE